MITFTLALIPIMGLVGAAVDYSRANSDRTAMQSAVDATALMLSKTIATLTTAQINQKSADYFAALFNRTDVNDIVLTPTYDSSAGGQVLLTATGKVPTTFMKVMGQTNIDISVSSTVRWGETRLRVALVLDTTGSMADSGKIGAMQTATKNLLSQLQSAVSQNGDVYVSIIPFSKDVNVDPANRSANWIDWTDWNNINGSCSRSQYTTKSTCTAAGRTWTTANHNTWNGCVVDRGNSNGPSSSQLRHQRVAASRRHDGLDVLG